MKVGGGGWGLPWNRFVCLSLRPSSSLLLLLLFVCFAFFSTISSDPFTVLNNNKTKITTGLCMIAHQELEGRAKRLDWCR